MLHWQWKPFQELTLDALYSALALRSEVFVVEQKSLYLDADGHDEAADHLLGWRDDEGRTFLGAYLRVLPPGEKFDEPSIGRVVTSPRVRGRGVGRELVRRGLEHLDARFPGRGCRISAQLYLQAFYEGFGFKVVTDVYDEDGIPHVQMVR